MDRRGERGGEGGEERRTGYEDYGAAGLLGDHLSEGAVG